MSEGSKLKIPAPAIAIALIVVAALLAERYLIAKRPSPTPAPAVVAEPDPVPEIEEVKSIATGVVPDEPKVTPVAKTWSTYHGNTDLAGYTDISLPESLRVLWRVQAEHGIYHTPVADENGIYIHTLKGVVYGLTFDGEERWKRTFERPALNGDGMEPQHLDAPISCIDGQVYVSSIGGEIFALDAETGETLWLFDAETPILGTINRTGAGDLVFIDQADGSIHALNPDTGETTWKGEPIDRCDGSPSTAGDYIVYGSCAAALHLFSAKDGTLIRNIELDPDSQVAGGVAIAGDSLFSGSHSGFVFRANAKSGDVIWMNESSMAEVFSTPAVSESLIVVGSLDGMVYALDRDTGEERWAFETIGLPTSVAIAKDEVIVASDGVLYRLSLETGEERWQYEVSDEVAAPAIINGMIVVGSSDGTIVAFGA